jgi:REP element-mobilizing transposase RayT
MARRLRVQFSGAIYHVMSRGDRREDIFRDDGDRERFLATLDETCAKTGWLVHAFCLMRNHFHLVVETPQPNLVAGMKWMLGTYTARFNRRHKVVGHLFSGRYKSQLVSGQGGYLRTVCDYVHLNPVRAKLLRPEAPLRSFRWSSLPALLQPPKLRPRWLRAERLFGEQGIPFDSEAGRREFERRLELRRADDGGGGLEELRRAWCLGDDQFKSELLGQMSSHVGHYHFGPELQESAEATAARIVQEELHRRDWMPDTLAKLKKGHPEKIAIARRLRAETTMTLHWIARHLHMGTKGYLTHLLYWENRNRESRGSGGARAILARRKTEAARASPARPPAPEGVNLSIPLTDPVPEDLMRFD